MTINPFDNDRLKTRKLREELAAAGTLPALRRDRPTFLRALKATEHQINHTSGAAPIVLHGQPRLDALILNSLFNTLASGIFIGGEVDAAGGMYTLNGEPCDISEIIDLASPYTRFDPEQDIDEDGIKSKVLVGQGFPSGDAYESRRLALKDPMRSRLLNLGFTCVLEAYSESGDGLNFELFDATNSDNAFVFANELYANVWPFDDQHETFEDTGLVSNQVNRFAFTFTSERISVSINGDPASTVAHAGITPAAENILIEYQSGPNGRLRSFEFFETVADVDLPALSALS